MPNLKPPESANQKEIMRLILTILIASILTSCTKHNISENFTGVIVAIPKSAKLSGWILNHCGNSEPIKLDDLSCAQIGGEIFITKIAFPRDNKNRLIGELNQILVVQHALLIEKTNQNKWCFNLKPIAGELRRATGVNFIAMNYKRNCDDPNEIVLSQ